MATVTFDTLKFVQTLESAGIGREQASAFAAAVRDAHDAADVATKGDIALIRKDLGSVEMGLHKDIDNLRWTMRLVLGGLIALILKSFF